MKGLLVVTKMDFPYLVQRVIFRKNSPNSAKGVDKYFGFDYMGSSEFEWGALPKALEEMRAAHPAKWKPKKIQVKDKIVWYVGSEESFPCAEALFKDQLGGQKCRLKEITGIAASLSPKEPRPFYSGYDGWWAIDAQPPWAFFIKKEHAKMWLEGLLAKS